MRRRSGNTNPPGGSTTTDRQRQQSRPMYPDYRHLSDEDLLMVITPIRLWLKSFSPWVESQLFPRTPEGRIDLNAVRLLESWKDYFDLSPYAKDIQRRSDECKVGLAERDNQPSEAEQAQQTQEQPAVPAVPPPGDADPDDDRQTTYLDELRAKGVFSDDAPPDNSATQPSPAVAPSDVVPPERPASKPSTRDASSLRGRALKYIARTTPREE